MPPVLGSRDIQNGRVLSRQPSQELHRPGKETSVVGDSNMTS